MRVMGERNHHQANKPRLDIISGRKFNVMNDKNSPSDI